MYKKIIKAFRFLDALIKISRFVPDLFLSDMIFKKDIGGSFTMYRAMGKCVKVPGWYDDLWGEEMTLWNSSILFWSFILPPSGVFLIPALKYMCSKQKDDLTSVLKESCYDIDRLFFLEKSANRERISVKILTVLQRGSLFYIFLGAAAYCMLFVRAQISLWIVMGAFLSMVIFVFLLSSMRTASTRGN